MSESPVYREYPPHPALARHVECYWTVIARIDPEASVSERVLPDGCMDILFSLAPGQNSSENTAEQPTVVGTMTRPLAVTYSGAIQLLGVRFRPGGGGPFLAAHARDLADTSIDLEDLWGRDAHDLWERLILTNDDVVRVALLDRALLNRLERTRMATDSSVLAASELVSAYRGGISVEAVASNTGLSRRQLERRFLAAVGITPKTACRVARFREAVALLHTSPSISLSHVALHAGYADQPHLTREFRTLAGTTPDAYRRHQATK